MNRTKLLLACRIFLIAGLLTSLEASAAAQGRVLGVVRDRDGNGIPGATVTAESLVSTTSETVTTEDSGRFSFIGLSRGEWLFVIRADGFLPVQGFANVRTAGSGINVQFTMDADRFNPPAPAGGLLAGLKASELVESLEAADGLFESGEFDAAIDAYRSVLERAPALTSLYLQIGHAFQEKQEPEQALTAFQAALDADPSNAEALAAVDLSGRTVR
jgi:tetratricopeptide (TPR) repeat protein